MKNILQFFLIIALLISQIHLAGSQPGEQQDGFWVELKDESTQNLVSKTFIDFKTIKRLPLDSALTVKKDDGSEITWIGANLCSLLQERLNISCESITRLAVSAPDGYASVVSGELLPALARAICAYQLRPGEEWSGSYGYARLIFPGLRGMYWVNSPNKMVITIGKIQKLLHHYQCYFLDQKKFSSLIKADLKGNLYTVIDNLLVELKLPQNSFRVLTADGLFREYPQNEINRYFVFQKQQSGNWEINGINIPHGLKTRQVFFLSSGNNGIFLKELTHDEQQTWEPIFWQQIVGENFSIADLKIELVLNDAGRILLNGAAEMAEKRFSLYNFLLDKFKYHPDSQYFMMSW